MGLFSTKKKTFVSSVVYNLAGDEVDRPDYLKSLLAQHMAASERTRNDLADTITNGFLRGPMQDRRAFLRWMTQHYPSYLLTGTLQGSQEIPRMTLDLTGYIPKANPAAKLKLNDYFVERADYFYWAENFIAQAYPAKLSMAWTCDLRADGVTVDVSFPDTTTTSFVMGNYDPDATYLYVRYDEIVRNNKAVVTSRIPYIWTYKMGSGTYPKIEALLRTATPEQEFFPVIPLRSNNVSVADSPHYDNVNKIYRKLTNRAKLETLLESIESNESIDDIDYAAIIFGVPVNDKSKAGKKYIYNFFRKLMSYQNSSTAAFLRWRDRAIEDAAVNRETRDPAISSLVLTGAGAYNRNYRFELAWAAIDESFHNGLGKAGAVKGDIWFEDAGNLTYIEFLSREETPIYARIPIVDLFWQTSAGRYKKLRLYGMKHLNYVYGGKVVETDLADGIVDADDSEFFLPLHNPTLKTLRTTESTQLATSSTLLVFNCYKIKKLKWYQTGIFKILLIIVSIAFSVFINPAALGAASGILGTNLAVGTAVGLSGLTAIVVGAAANAIAGMILASVIQEAAGELFGDQLGALIGSLTAFFVMNFGSGLFSGEFNFAEAWNKMMLPENLIRLTEAGTNALTNWAYGGIAEIQEKAVELTEDYEEESYEIAEKYAELIGYGGVSYDPLLFAETLGSSTMGRFTESSTSFIRRTLLVGSDLAEIQQTMITDYPELSLKLPEAID